MATISSIVEKKYSKSTRLLKDVIASVSDNEYRLDLPIQRGCVWSKNQKDSFIHTCFNNSTESTVTIVTVNGEMYVGDGKQRLTTCDEFKNNNYVVSSDMIVRYRDVVGKDDSGNKVLSDRKEFNLKGKKYSDIPTNIRNLFDRFVVSVSEYDEMSDEDLVETFTKLNNGTKLGACDGYRTIIFKKNPEFLDELDRIVDKYNTENSFFDRYLGNKKTTASDALTAMLRAMMIMRFKDNGFRGSITGKSITKFITSSLVMEDINKVEASLEKISTAKNISSFKNVSGIACYVIAFAPHTTNITGFFNNINECLSNNRDEIFTKDGSCNTYAVDKKMSTFSKLASNAKI